MSLAGFVISFFAIIAGIGVVCMRNPLYSAFALIVNLLSVAGLYAVMNAHFLAVSQIVVYAGAVMVLVLFVLMLLNLKSESGRSLGFGRAFFAGVAGLVIFVISLPPLLTSFSLLTPADLADRARGSEGSVYNVGRLLYTQYLVHFELASLVLLIGIVGAVMLARRRLSTIEPRGSGVGGSL